MAVRCLQDLARIYIRRTLRNLINNDVCNGSVPQAAPKRKRRHCRRHCVSTYVYVENQLIPKSIDSEEEVKMNDNENLEEEQEKYMPEEPLINLLRKKILSLPLPGSLKGYLMYYREK